MHDTNVVVHGNYYTQDKWHHDTRYVQLFFFGGGGLHFWEDSLFLHSEQLLNLWCIVSFWDKLFSTHFGYIKGSLEKRRQQMYIHYVTVYIPVNQ